MSKYFQDASPRICLGPIDINSELLEGDIVKLTGVVVDTMCLWTDLLKYFVDWEFQVYTTGFGKDWEKHFGCTIIS